MNSAPNMTAEAQPGTSITHGELSQELLAREIEIAIGANRFATNWENKKVSVRQLIGSCSGFQRGPKDGTAFLQGSLRKDCGTYSPAIPATPTTEAVKQKSDRNTANMSCNYVVNIDLETGAPIAELVALIESRGLFAVIHTTHSHMKTTSAIKQSELADWMRKHDRTGEPTAADAVGYLEDVKQYRAAILAGAALLPLDGDEYTVKHQPMPRARIVLLLKTPYVFDGKDAIEEWKRLYDAIAKWLALVYDKACVDPARLMYVPRISVDADISQHEIHVIAGEPLDADKVPRPAKPEPQGATAAKAKAPGAGRKAGDEFETPELAKFMRIGAASFRASACLRELDPPGVRNIYTNESKHDHKCPREEGHTDPSEADRAFMVRDAVPGGNGFGMTCRHAGCIALATKAGGKEDRAVFLDRFCQRHGIEDASKLLQWCSDEARSEWDPSRGFEADRLLLDPTDHMRSARQFVEARHTVGGVRTLHWHQGEWFRWDGRRYVVLGDGAIRSELWLFLETADRLNKDSERISFKPSKPLVENAIEALRAQTPLPTGTTAPAWLGPDQADRPPAGEMLVCANGLLHLTKKKLFAHTPLFFSVNALPYAYDPNAPKPERWLRLLDEIFAGDAESILCLQVWFWLNLSSDLRQQKILYLKGLVRSGKGTLMEVLRMLLGPENVATPMLGRITEPHGLQGFLGKIAVHVSDVRLDEKVNMRKLVELLLAISGGDPVDVTRKFLPPVTGHKLRTLITMGSNDPLKLRDASGAVATRFVVLETQGSWLGREDVDLGRKLAGEISGILNWALQGYVQLLWGGFKQPKTSAHAVDSMRDTASPVGAFIRECCDVGPGRSVDTDELYAAFIHWASATGRNGLENNRFGIDLNSVIPGLRLAQPRTGDPDKPRGRVHVGVSLNPPNSAP